MATKDGAHATESEKGGADISNANAIQDKAFLQNPYYLEQIIHRSGNCIIVAN